MKHEIKAKTNVQLLCFGKIMRSGETYVYEGELPVEVIRAKQQGLISIAEVATPKKEPAKVEPKKVEEPPKTDVKVDLDALSTMTRPELDKLATSLGLNPEDYSNMTKIRSAIRKKVQ